MNQVVLNTSRNDKFLFVLDLPKALKNVTDSVLNSSYNADSIQFKTYGSPVPQISVPSIKVPYAGQNYNTSSITRPAYDPLKVNFLLDNGYQNYWILWNWLNLFNDSKDSTTDLTTVVGKIGDHYITNPMSDYTSNFTIYGLDEYNNKIISFTYKSAFITNLSEISFSHQDPKEIICSATFVFNQLYVDLLKDVNVSSC
jgi:hypothetical protein